MARKAKGSWKNLKAGQFKKTSKIEIDEERSLVFQSLNPVKEKKIINQLIRTVEVPTKERKATKEEKDEYNKIHPNTNTALLKDLKVIYFDYTDKEYLETLKEQEGWIQLAIELINVDLTDLWEDMELENNEDFIGLAKFLFEYLEFDEAFLKKVKLAQRQIKGDLISTGLLEIENLFKDNNSFDMLGIMAEMIDKKKAEKEVESNDEGIE